MYGFLVGICFWKSLLESFEFLEVFELVVSGECCFSCDIFLVKKFNCKEIVFFFFKVLEEVVKLLIIKFGVSEEKVIFWLCGFKRGWIIFFDI